jgi:hypothetical protein
MYDNLIRRNPLDSGQTIEFIPLSFWYDAPLRSQYSDRMDGLDHGVGHLLSTTTTDHQRRDPTEG